MNVFISLFLAIIIMLTKLTCLSSFFILHILRNRTFLHSIIKTYIIFQSSRIILLLYISQISVFTNSLYIFAIFSIIVPIFQHPKSEKAYINPLNAKLQFNTFFAPMFYTVIFIMFLTLTFYSSCSTDF